ncbi:hypothetical protein ACX0G9_10095 [Flavitalea flava]
MNDQEIYEHHNDLFSGDDNFELIDISAEVLGRQIGKIAIRNSKIFTRIDGILDVNIFAGDNSKVGRIMTKYFHNDVAENVKRLFLIRKGLNTVTLVHE